MELCFVCPSPPGVIAVTEPSVSPVQNCAQETDMPILMLALIALVAFGLIGVLLFTAGSMERHNNKKETPVGR